jgi:hypothetical protein
MRQGLRGLGLVGMLALVGCLSGGAQTPSPTPTPGEVVDMKKQLAIVEASKLLEKHPDFEKLKDLETQVMKLEGEKRDISDNAKKNILKNSRDTFLRAYKDARAEMEAEQAAISGEMEGLARALQGQMGAELGEIKAKLDQELQGEIKKYRPADTLKLNDVGTQAVGEYAENLRLMASRNLTAHRLEKEKAIKGEIDAERNRLDQQLAVYEDEVSMRYQEEKLNLQLKMQNSPSEDVEKVTRERLNAIDDEVAAAKADKRKEIEATMSAFHDRKQAEFEADVKGYEARLKDEMMAKVGGRRTQLQNQPGTSQAPPPEVKAKIDSAQATFQQAMETRKAELMGKMKQKESEARARLEAKQEQIKRRLSSLEKELESQLAKRTDFLDKKSREKLKQLDKDLEKARADRKVVFDKMQGDLAVFVGKVADKKGIPCVIGTCVVNLDLEDLTDLSMVEVAQIGNR